MKLIEKAVSHFSSRERRSLYIPEWEATIYARNVNLEDKSSWMKRSDGDHFEFMLYAVIGGAEDENGEPCFDIGDKPKLKKAVDPDIVSTIATFVLETSAKNDEEREKN